MKKILLCALALVLSVWLAWPTGAALAEDCFTLDIDTLDLDSLNSDDYVSQALSSSAQGIRVRKFISDSSELAAPVRLTLKQMNTGAIVFDKDYGYQSGSFDSGVIYLPYTGDGVSPYLVSLYVGNYVYALPFMQQQRRLTYNGACTVGPRLRDLDASMANDWFMGTVVDLDALRGGSLSVDLCASNTYLIGTATVSLSGNSLCVQLSFTPSAQVEVSQQSLYVTTPGRALSSAPAHAVGDWVDVGDASAALIYLPMQLSYDPSQLPGFSYESCDPQGQIALWTQANASREGEEQPSVDWAEGAWSGSDSEGQSSGGEDWGSYTEPSTDESAGGDEWVDSSGWADNDGWDSGWSNDGWDADYGWDDGWSSGADGWE